MSAAVTVAIGKSWTKLPPRKIVIIEPSAEEKAELICHRPWRSNGGIKVNRNTLLAVAQNGRKNDSSERPFGVSRHGGEGIL